MWPGRGRDVVLVAARLRATSKWRSACTWEEAGSSNGRGRSEKELWEAGSPAHSNACFGWCAPGAWSTEEPELVQTGLTQDRFPVWLEEVISCGSGLGTLTRLIHIWVEMPQQCTTLEQGNWKANQELLSWCHLLKDPRLCLAQSHQSVLGWAKIGLFGKNGFLWLKLATTKSEQWKA